MKKFIFRGFCVLFGLFALLLAIGAMLPNQPTSPPIASPVNAATAMAQSRKSTAPSNRRFAQCRAKLKKAKGLEVLYDMDWKPPSEPRVVVGSTFFTIPIDAKEGFADTVNCFLTAGETGKYINFNLLDWQTGKPVGRYSYGSFAMN